MLPIIFTNRKSAKTPVKISGFSNFAEIVHREILDIKGRDYDISFWDFYLQSPVEIIGSFSKKRFLELIFD